MKHHAALFASLLRIEAPPYVYWKSPEGEIWITAGASARLTPPQPSAWRSWLHGGAFSASASKTLPRLAILGFMPESPAEGVWTGFPSVELFEPSVGYHLRDGAETFFGMAGDSIPEDSEADSELHVTEQVQIEIRDWKAQRYRGMVAEGLELLRQGEMEKIVLARDIDIDLQSAFNPARAIQSLQHQPHSFSILYSPDGERFFVSATPERLGRVKDGRFRTMALAGTVPAGDEDMPDAADLLVDAKERAEHAYVVEMIRREATEFCTDNVVDSISVLTLPHVTHILTQIEGMLSENRGMGDVIAALHPTPAIAGTPRGTACSNIAELESFARGLYAGCIGWVDAEGNGDAAVAIRSAVVDGSRATAYAGAGIVIGSNPADEEIETRAKLQTILDILGS